MQVDLLGSAQSAHALHLFHQHSPLVHCMTKLARWIMLPMDIVSLVFTVVIR